MRKLYFHLHLPFLLMILLASCGNQSSVQPDPKDKSKETIQDENYDPNLFPKRDDSALQLTGEGGERVKQLLKFVDSESLKGLYANKITPSEYDEIKGFTDKLVEDKKTDTEKFEQIFEWVSKEVKYGNGDNTAYGTFKMKHAVCQGYANLLNVMLDTQGILSAVANGMLTEYSTVGGHAWNYAYVDGAWLVPDPTNHRTFKIDDPKYISILRVEQLDFDLWPDDTFKYVLEKKHVTISDVKSVKGEVLSIPYSKNEVVVTNFNPEHIPDNVRTLYIGDNIETLGTPDYVQRIKSSGKSLTHIYISPTNKHIESYKGIIYSKKDSSSPLYIPTRLKKIEFKPTEVFEKNVLTDHEYVEEIVFPAGTKKIDSYAIENCPKLKRVYLPIDAVIEKDALYRCPSDVEIIRQ